MKERDRGQSSSLTLEQVVALASERILVDGFHAPTMLLEGNKDNIVTQLDFDTTPEKRQMQMFLLGAMLGSYGHLGKLKQVFLISEGWMKTLKGDSSDSLRPSEDPQRVEVLTIYHAQAAEEKTVTRMRNYEMLRNAAGQLVDLVEHADVFGDEHKAESPLLNAFLDGFKRGSESQDSN